MNVVATEALDEALSDGLRHLLALGDELHRVVLGDGRGEELRADGGQHLVVPVSAQLTVDFREVVDLGLVQNLQRVRRGGGHSI